MTDTAHLTIYNTDLRRRQLLSATVHRPLPRRRVRLVRRQPRG